MGKGKIQEDGYSTDTKFIVCHGCNGRGWIEVNDDYYWTPYLGENDIKVSITEYKEYTT